VGSSDIAVDWLQILLRSLRTTVSILSPEVGYVTCGFPQTLEDSSVIVHKKISDRFLSNPLITNISLSV
jgi:hypothetical protein